MNFNQIRCFLAAAETLNFTAAADACSISQPALSKAIQNLEATLGSQLFDRDKQRVVLTDFGRTMRIHLERIEENRRKALDAAKVAANTPTDQLDVGIMCTVGPTQFGPFLKSFHEAYPNVAITMHDVTPGTIPELLLSGSLDCVLCGRSAKHDQRFQAVELFVEGVVVAFAPSHRFSDMASVPLADIAKEKYLDRLHCEFRTDFLEHMRGSGLELDISFRSEREDWTLELLKSGYGISVLPASSSVLEGLSYRPVEGLDQLRKLEIVLTAHEPVTSVLAAFKDAAAAFDWR